MRVPTSRDMCFPAIHRPPKQGKVLSLPGDTRWRGRGRSYRISPSADHRTACIQRAEKFGECDRRGNTPRRPILLVFSLSRLRETSRCFIVHEWRKLEYYPRSRVNSMAAARSYGRGRETNFGKTYRLQFPNKDQRYHRSALQYSMLNEVSQVEC